MNVTVFDDCFRDEEVGRRRQSVTNVTSITMSYFFELASSSITIFLEIQ